MLESSDRDAEEIGADVGYSDASFVRRLFKRLVGITPGQYRRMFQRTGSALARTGRRLEKIHQTDPRQ